MSTTEDLVHELAALKAEVQELRRLARGCG